MHEYFNTTNFPIFVCRHGNWNLYRDERGYCASIPTAEAVKIGCRASHFGDAAYVFATLGVRI